MSTTEVEKNIFKCPAVNCKNSFSRVYNLNRHYERFHLNNDLAEKCLLCGNIYSSCQELQNHYKKNHKPTKKFVLKESAFRKTVVTYRYTFSSNSFDFDSAQQTAFPAINELLLLEASKKTLIKVGMIFICEMSMLDYVGEKVHTTLIPFRASSFLANGYSKNGLQQNIQRSFMLQKREMEDFCNCGSNWIFDRAIAFDLEIAAMRPILIGNNTDENIESETQTSECSNDDDEKEEKKQFKNVKNSSDFYDSKHVPTFNLHDFKNSKFLFNPTNNDEKCFLHCLHEHLKLTKPKKYEKISFKMFERSLNLKNITFPISVPQVKKFCKQNTQLGLKINILLRNTKKHLFPLEYGIGESTTSKNVVNLLLLQRKISTKNTIQNHFLLIKDIHNFTRKTYEHGRKEKSVLCVNCFNKFSSKTVLAKHEEICCLHKPRIERCSTDLTHIQFTNYQNQHPLEYIAFLDFECVLPKVKSRCPECTHLRCKCDRSFTEPMTEQYPVTYSLVILDQNSTIIHEKTYSCENAADHLVDHLLEQEELWISNLFKGIQTINMTTFDWKRFHDTENCYLCGTEFLLDQEKTVKCRDHCHFTGKFLGAACQACNLKRQRPRKLNIFLHNGSKYDFHFIVKALNNKKKVKNINILPYNGENFRTISFNCFLFIDSMSFLQSSLAKLSSDLANTDNAYSILRQTYLVKSRQNYGRNVFSLKKFNMVLGKSFFPYEFW